MHQLEKRVLVTEESALRSIETFETCARKMNFLAFVEQSKGGNVRWSRLPIARCRFSHLQSM